LIDRLNIEHYYYYICDSIFLFPSNYDVLLYMYRLIWLSWCSWYQLVYFPCSILYCLLLNSHSVKWVQVLDKLYAFTCTQLHNLLFINLLFIYSWCWRNRTLIDCLISYFLVCCVAVVWLESRARVVSDSCCSHWLFHCVASLTSLLPC